MCLCVHALWAFVLGLLQCCLPGFVVCFKVLMVSFSFPFHFVDFAPSPPLLSPPPLYTNPCLHTSCLGAGTSVALQPKLSPSTHPPFSTPPAPSPANGPPSPKFGRDTLSYCLKEINKTVKPRISSFRTLRRSVSHQRKRFECQATSSHRVVNIILCYCRTIMQI